MKADDFGAWRRKLGLTQEEAAQMLGISRGTVIDYERGRWRSGGEAKIPKAVELACQALEWGATAYSSGVNRLHRGDDRPYASWVQQEVQILSSELENRARTLFPKDWAHYAYVVICPPECDDPVNSTEIHQAASSAGISFDYKILPISKKSDKGWVLHLKCAVFKNLTDAILFKTMFKH